MNEPKELYKPQIEFYILNMNDNISIANIIHC